MRRTIALFACVAALAAAGAAAAPGRAQHQRPSPESVIKMPPAKVAVEDFPAEGLILDVGGGGEGIIGQVKTKQVVAIDLVKRELEGAPPGPLLKIVMDARALGFLDGTFPTATVFFTFMYMAPEDHAKAFAELHRVLAPGGRLLVWDVLAPQPADEAKSWALYPLELRLPGGKIVNTGYGVRLPKEGRQGLMYFAGLAESAGFCVTGSRQEEWWFFLEAVKR